MAIRITGFSGLDIDSLVKDLMKAKRVPLDRLNQQKTKLEWQREQYRSINAKLVDFRNNKLFNYSLSSAINAKKASVTGEGAFAVTAKANSTSVAGTLSIEVIELATAAYARTDENNALNATSSTLLKNLGFTAVEKDGNKIIEIEIVKNKDAGENEPEYKTITLSENATIGDLVREINANNDLGLIAFFDDATGRLSLTAKQTGTGKIELASQFEEVFKLTDAEAGQQAVVVINGIETRRDSNTFTVNGVEITLNAAAPGKTAVINVTTDTDKIVDTIKTFINEYNSLIDLLNKKVSEQRYRDYEPLTADQKKEMKESEIELWEEKAKSGLLRNDTTLTNLINDLRISIYTSVKVNGKDYNLLRDFGIETGTWEQKGKLILKNEDQLRAAIEADPEAVMAFFTKQTTVTDPDIKDSPANTDNGLFNRLSAAFMRAIDQLAAKAGTSKFSTDETVSFSPNSYIGEQLRQLEMRISDLNKKLNQMENRYYLQFAAMEAAVNRYAAMSSSLFGMTM